MGAPRPGPGRRARCDDSARPGRSNCRATPSPARSSGLTPTLLIRASPEGFTAVDLGSANGTLLNGTPFAEPTLLASGDILELAGDTRFVFEQDEDEGDTGTDRKGTLLVLAFATIAWRWRKSDAVFDQAAATAAAGLKADWSS